MMDNKELELMCTIAKAQLAEAAKRSQREYAEAVDSGIDPQLRFEATGELPDLYWGAES